MWMTSYPVRCLFVVMVAVVLFGLGCSGAPSDDTAELAPSGGMVALDGEPVAHAAVTLIPTGKTGQAAHGVTDEMGMFILKNARGREGAEAGTYKVSISKFAMEDGSPFPPDADSGDFAALGVEHLPAKYSNPEQSELTAEIPPTGKSDLYFELTTE